jgi:hypothetical protein
MNDQVTTNWYECSKCGKPCDVTFLLKVHSVRMSSCCQALATVRSSRDGLHAKDTPIPQVEKKEP